MGAMNAAKSGLPASRQYCQIHRQRDRERQVIATLLGLRTFLRTAFVMLRKYRANRESQAALISSPRPQTRDDGPALYRLYLFSHLNRIVGFVELKCQSDAEAREHAQQLASEGRYELWGRGNLLGTAELLAPIVHTRPQ
jgi:hypothetical protein